MLIRHGAFLSLATSVPSIASIVLEICRTFSKSVLAFDMPQLKLLKWSAVCPKVQTPNYQCNLWREYLLTTIAYSWREPSGWNTHTLLRAVLSDTPWSFSNGLMRNMGYISIEGWMPKEIRNQVCIHPSFYFITRFGDCRQYINNICPMRSSALQTKYHPNVLSRFTNSNITEEQGQPNRKICTERLETQADIFGCEPAFEDIPNSSFLSQSYLRSSSVDCWTRKCAKHAVRETDADDKAVRSVRDLIRIQFLTVMYFTLSSFWICFLCL